MKYIFLFIILSISSCQSNETLSEEKLIGKWETTTGKKSQIVLQISKTKISRLENGNKIVYDNYSISGDTLILMNNKVKEKHLIELLKNTKLRFGAVNPYQEDIELIDAVEFVKSN